MGCAVNRSLVAVLAAAASLALPSAATAAVVRPAPLPSAAQTLSACVQNSGKLLVVASIDASGSIAYSDPDARRVDGVSAALIGLEQLAEQTGHRHVQVRVMLSSFAGAVQPGSWQTLSPGTLGDVLAAARVFATRDQGRDTDYVLALADARARLLAHAREVRRRTGVEPCKAVLFVTDGKYRLSQRGGAIPLPRRVFYAPGTRLDARDGTGPRDAMDAGQHYLCDAGGLRDRYAQDRIVLFGVALSVKGNRGAADPAYLADLTNGAAGGGSCGAVRRPATGSFFDAHRPSELFLVLASLLEGPVELQPHNAGSFVAPPGTAGFALNVSTRQAPHLALVLTDPTGVIHTLLSSATKAVPAAGATLLPRWFQARSLLLQAHFPPHTGRWNGTWGFQVVVVGGTPAPHTSYTLRLLTGLRPELFDTPRLERGRTVTLHLRLTDRTGAVVRGGELVRSAHIRAWMDGGAGPTSPIAARPADDGTFTLPVAIPERGPAHGWRIYVEVRFDNQRPPVSSYRGQLPLPGFVDAPTFPWRLVAAATAVLGLLGALVALVTQLLGARFAAPERLRVLVLDATIEPQQAVRLSRDPETIDVRDFRPFEEWGGEAGRRRIVLDDFILHARASLLPSGSAHGETTARAVVGGTLDGGQLPSLDGHRTCQTPLALPGTWLFSVRDVEPGGTIRGHLLLIGEAGDTRTAELLRRARDTLADRSWDDLGDDGSGGGEGGGGGREEEPSPLDWENV